MYQKKTERWLCLFVLKACHGEKMLVTKMVLNLLERISGQKQWLETETVKLDKFRLKLRHKLFTARQLAMRTNYQGKQCSLIKAGHDFSMNLFFSFFFRRWWTPELDVSQERGRPTETFGWETLLRPGVEFQVETTKKPCTQIPPMFVPLAQSCDVGDTGYSPWSARLMEEPWTYPIYHAAIGVL